MILIPDSYVPKYNDIVRVVSVHERDSFVGQDWIIGLEVLVATPKPKSFYDGTVAIGGHVVQSARSGLKVGSFVVFHAVRVEFVGVGPSLDTEEPVKTKRDVVEEWFEELGIDVSVSDVSRLLGKLDNTV